MSFKVGDWVYYAGSVTPTQIRSIGANVIYMSNQYTTGKDGTSLNIWEPQVNEWCWFSLEMDVGDFEPPTLMQYGKHPKHTPWEIEPFIGSLPSWCKEET